MYVNIVHSHTVVSVAYPHSCQKQQLNKFSMFNARKVQTPSLSLLRGPSTKNLSVQLVRSGEVWTNHSSCQHVTHVRNFDKITGQNGVVATGGRLETIHRRAGVRYSSVHDTPAGGFTLCTHLETPAWMCISVQCWAARFLVSICDGGLVYSGKD